MMSKITLEDLAEIRTLLTQAEIFRPVVREFIDVLKSYGPEIDEVLGGISNWVVDNRIAQIKRLEAAQFSRDDAIIISTSINQGVQDALKQRRSKV